MIWDDEAKADYAAYVDSCRARFIRPKPIQEYTLFHRKDEPCDSDINERNKEIWKWNQK